MILKQTFGRVELHQLALVQDHYSKKSKCDEESENEEAKEQILDGKYKTIGQF